MKTTLAVQWKNLGCVLVLGVLSACSDDTPAESASAVSAVAAVTEASMLQEVSEGAGKTQETWALYTYGHEVSSLVPCGTQTEYWADGEETVMKPLEEASMEKAEKMHQPYQSVLAKVSISAPENNDEGFAAEYDGVVKIYRAEQIQADASCPAVAH